MVDANRGYPDREPLGAELVEQIGGDGLTRLGAEPADPARCVVAGEGGEIHQRDGPQQPGGLPLLLHRSAAPQRGGSALNRAPVDPDFAQPREVQRHSRITGLNGDIEAGPRLIHRPGSL